MKDEIDIALDYILYALVAASVIGVPVILTYFLYRAYRG